MAGVYLTEAAKIAVKDWQKYILKNVIETSPFLDYLPFQTAPNLKYNFVREANLPSSQFRAINGTFTEALGSFADASIDLAVLGGKFAIDDVVKKMRTIDGRDVLEKNLDMWSRALSMDYKKYFITGDPATPGQFKGIRKWILDVHGVDSDTEGGANLLYGGGATNTNGLAISSSTVLIDSINEGLDLAAKSGGMGKIVILCNRRHLAKMNSLLTTGNNTALAGYFKYSMATIGGKEQRIGLWMDNIPMIPMDTDSQGAEIIDFNETHGNSDLNSSMYYVNFGDMLVSGLQQEATGPVLKQIPGESDTYKIEWACGAVVEHKYAAVRQYGILGT